MADQNKKKKTPENSRRREDEPASKKQKLNPPEFLDPVSLVTFLIGKNKEKFIIHKEAACHYSPVLKVAFNSDFKEGQTQTYILEDTTPGAFRLFFQWIYSQNLKTFLLDDLVADNTILADAGAKSQRLAELWVLADKLILPRLQNLVLVTIRKISNRTDTIPTGIIPYVYEHTGKGSLLRRFIVDLCCLELSAAYLTTQGSFTKDFLLDLAFAMATERDIIGASIDFSVTDYLVEENV